MQLKRTLDAWFTPHYKSVQTAEDLITVDPDLAFQAMFFADFPDGVPPTGWVKIGKADIVVTLGNEITDFKEQRIRELEKEREQTVAELNSKIAFINQTIVKLKEGK